MGATSLLACLALAGSAAPALGQDEQRWEELEGAVLQAVRDGDLGAALEPLRTAGSIKDWERFEEWVRGRELDYLRYHLRFTDKSYTHESGWSLPATRADEALAVRWELVASLTEPKWGAYGWYACAAAHLRLEDYSRALAALREHERALAMPHAWADAEESRASERINGAGLRVDLFLAMGLLDLALEQTPLLNREYARIQSEPEASPEEQRWASRHLWQRARLDVAREDWGALRDWLQGEVPRSFEAVQRPRAWYILGQAIYEADPEDATARAKAVLALETSILAAEENLAADLGVRRDNALIVVLGHLRIARIALARWDPTDRDEVALRLEEIHRAESRFPELLGPATLGDVRIHEVQFVRKTGSAVSDELALSLQEQWLRMVASWRDAPYRPGGISPLEYRNAQRIMATVLDVVCERQGPRAAMQEVVRAQRASSVFKAPGGVRSPEGSLAVPDIPPGELLLVYLPSSSHTDVFALEGQRVERIVLPVGRDSLHPLARRLRTLLQSSPRSEQAHPKRGESLAAVAEYASHALLGDPAGRLRAILQRVERLTIVGWDLLGRIPFELLRGDDSRAIGLTHAIAYLPVLPLRGQWQGAPWERECDLEVMAGSADLTVPPSAVEGWARYYGDGPSRVTLNGAARAADLASGSSKVLQILGHGDRADGELFATIRLFGGTLDRATIRSRRAAPAVVLLTACESGAGRQRSGDGVLGALVNAWLERATPCVVATQSAVDFHATLEWSRVFHWALGAGRPPAVAALEARRALANSDAYRDPYYHSLLAVIGEGYLVPLERPAGYTAGPRPNVGGEPRRWPWFAAALGALILVAFSAFEVNRHRAPAGAP